MHRPLIFLLSILLVSPFLTPFAFTVPSLHSLTQKNHTAAPIRILDGHNLHLAAPPPPACYFIIDPPLSGLSASKCAFLAEDVCSNLASLGPQAHNKWIWSEIPGCALGYYLSHGVHVPSMDECEDQIFEKIIDKCAGNWRYNSGSMNVLEYPDFSGDGTGEVPWMGRYMMAPERLTL